MSNENQNKMDSEIQNTIDEELKWSFLIKHFVGNTYRYRENIIIPKNLGPVVIKTKEEKMIESFFEGCPFKTVMSCVIGNK